MHAVKLALLFIHWFLPKACVAFQEPELHMWVPAELFSVPILLTGSSGVAQPSLKCSYLASQPTAFLSIFIKSSQVGSDNCTCSNIEIILFTTASFL